MSDISIQERPGVTQLQLIATNNKTADTANNIAEFLGRTTRLAPGEGARNGDLFICATGPREYWIFADNLSPPDAIKALTGVAGISASVFDQSAGRYVIRLAGRDAEALLAKGTSLDLHRDVFPTPGAAHSVIEHIPALIAKRGSYYDISVPRSYTASFNAWLREAAREYGYTGDPKC